MSYIIWCFLCCRIIAFDNERISVLEKRQAHLLNDNEETKQEIIRTLRENEKMAETMDTLLNIVTHTSQDHSKLVRDDQMEDLCEVMKEKCKLAEMTVSHLSESQFSIFCRLYLNLLCPISVFFVIFLRRAGIVG